MDAPLFLGAKETFDGAPVSEPGFLDFQIFRFSILDIFFLQNMFGKYVGEISGNK